jgi:hypothetical protein
VSSRSSCSEVLLEPVSLQYTRVTDDGLATIGGLTSLRTLELGGEGFIEEFQPARQITDAGLGKLAGLIALQKLRLDGTAVTDKGIAKLRAILPAVKVVR